MQAIFLVGTNGSGKSTYRNTHKDIFKDMINIDPDELAKQNKNDNAKGARIGLKMFSECLKNKTPFSIESTLSGKSVLKRMSDCINAGFSLKVIYIGLDSVELNIKRVEKRVQNGGHDIPKHLIISRYDTSRQNLLKAMSFVDDIILIDNSVECDDGAAFKECVIIKNKIITKLDKNCKWINKLFNL